MWRVVAVAIVLMAGDAGAQERPSLVQLGGLGLTPSFRLTNFGLDSNVFVTEAGPQQDLTATFTPGLQSQWRLGPARMQATNNAAIVYFSRFESQRSIGTNNTITWDVPINRFQPYVAYTFNRNTRQPNFEITVRATEQAATATVGTRVRLSPRTVAAVEMRRGHTGFGDNASFQGVDLRKALDRKIETVASTFTYDLTPLTRVRVQTDWQDEEFDGSPERQNRNMAIKPGIEFAPSGLIRGTATIGYRSFDFADPAVPDRSGLLASVDMAYTFRGSTQFSVRAERDVIYSFQELHPYYVDSGVMTTVTQRVSDAWNVSFGIGRRRQVYTAVTSAPTPPASALSDEGQWDYSAGVGSRLGQTARFGFTVVRTHRASTFNPYDTVRAFATVTYEP